MKLPIDRNTPAIPDITGGSLCRSADNLERIIQQFDVANQPRYQRQETKLPDGSIHVDTFCNIYVGDCTAALNCEIPHRRFFYEAEADGKVIGKFVENNANTVFDWLTLHGTENGWAHCDAVGARVRANSGYPTVASWKNLTGGPGHIAMVVPRIGELYIAQSGKRCFYGEPLVNGFGFLSPSFWSHS